MKKLVHIFTIAILPITFILCCGKIHRDESTSPWLTFDWPEADSLFQRDLFWVGGDGAYSIDLGKERVLWLFGDSWIDTSGQANRNDAIMVSNTLAVQLGYDPSSATIKFFWQQQARQTGSYFPDFDGGRYWPGHGVRVKDKLLLFLMGVYSTDHGLGFEVRDWTPLLVTNPYDDPEEWKIKFFESKSNNLQVIVGSGGVLNWKEHIYAFGAQELESKHDIYLVRWQIDDILEGRFETIQWWAGNIKGWVYQISSKHNAVPVFSEGQTEFTVHYDDYNSMFVQFQTVGFGPATIVRRFASDITGPWSVPETIYSPSQNLFPRIMIYQGKAHPYLIGANLVATYCTNSFDFADHMKENWLYFPRFVRIK